jgi:hypothetical protein
MSKLGQLRPRRLPLVAAALALAVAAAATFLFVITREAPMPEIRAAGEPLKLKLEFAFPAARR